MIVKLFYKLPNRHYLSKERKDLNSTHGKPGVQGQEKVRRTNPNTRYIDDAVHPIPN